MSVPKHFHHMSTGTGSIKKKRALLRAKHFVLPFIIINLSSFLHAIFESTVYFTEPLLKPRKALLVPGMRVQGLCNMDQCVSSLTVLCVCSFMCIFNTHVTLEPVFLKGVKCC